MYVPCTGHDIRVLTVVIPVALDHCVIGRHTSGHVVQDGREIRRATHQKMNQVVIVLAITDAITASITLQSTGGRR